MLIVKKKKIFLIKCNNVAVLALLYMSVYWDEKVLGRKDEEKTIRNRNDRS